MTLGELKASLKKLPKDMDDLHVILQTTNDQDGLCYDNLSFTGVTKSEPYCVILGSMGAYLKLKDKEKLNE